jgi:S-adenosylmethionine/arginine decarboxylase-like enzyme
MKAQYHVMLELMNCDEAIISDMDEVYDFLFEAPSIIDMTRISLPQVFPYCDDDKPEDRGITGLVTLAESHCSAHTFIEKRRVYLDAYSCLEIDYEKFIEFARESFNSTKYKFMVVDRDKLEVIEKGEITLVPFYKPE